MKSITSTDPAKSSTSLGQPHGALHGMFRVLCCFILLLSGCSSSAPVSNPVPAAPWAQLEKQAKGTTVRIGMWDGDPLINAYMKEWVAEQLKNQYDITFEQIGTQGNNLVSKLMVDLETGRSSGDFDLVWINGETFYQLRKLNALTGPFTDRLPNNHLVDWSSRFVAIDFQQPVAGYECPLGSVQLALIYDSSRVMDPPKTRQQIEEWARQHPGRFTFDTGFTGLTFLKCLLYDFAGGPKSLDGPFDDAQYQEASAKLFAWLREIQPLLWRQGKTFPESVTQLHQLFRNGEVDFTMSNNDGEVDNKVIQGILPETSRAYVLESGTIRNSHYLGIPFNAPNKAGAMVVANFLLSPEAQLKKAQPAVWGDGTILDISKLPEEWQGRFRQVEGRTRVASREELNAHALMEPAPEIMIRLEADFRREIIERGQE
ncbi:MAG: ABC transporter substrate-binding protein [Planctomycetaceae bacterium]|nr:ABC transporter substrate-binding protein [Planctomycetaceae bacterium]